MTTIDSPSDRRQRLFDTMIHNQEHPDGGWVALNVYSFAYSVTGGVIDAALFWIWERRFTPQHTKIVIHHIPDIYGA
jgi:hypothetical protein